jgi:hypothetical protein
MIIGVNEFEPASKSFYQEQMKLTDKRYFGSKLFHHTKDRKRNNATGLKILLAHVNIIYDKDVPIPNFLKKLSTVFIEDFKEKNGCIEFDYTDWDSIEDRHVVLTIEEKALEKFMKLYNLKNIK